MKNRILFLLLSIGLLWSCSPLEKKYLIGISQCSQDEWRNKQNEEMLRQATVERNIELEIRSVKDDSEKATRYLELKKRHRELEINITLRNIESIKEKNKDVGGCWTLEVAPQYDSE